MMAGKYDTAAEQRLAQRAHRYASYDRCGECGALPRMPCRDRGWSGSWSRVVSDAPHPGRPKRASDD